MPKMEASDRFQGLCLLSMEGSQFMSSHDNFPPEVRVRSSSSPFNLCAACIHDIALGYSIQETGQWLPKPRHYLSAIERMENQIRCEEVK